MFTYAVRNIVHKQSTKDLSILYYPLNDILDHIITDWDPNFFIPTTNTSTNKIVKKNVCYISNPTLFEYDFILGHELNSNIIDISNRLHIPIITYLRYCGYDDSKIPDHKNVYYIAEHDGLSEQEKLLTLTPDITFLAERSVENNICLFINNSINYGDLIQILAKNIKNLSIVDEEKIDQNAMIEILSKHRVCIDLYPKSVYKLLFCSKTNTPYVTVQNEITNGYKKIYDGTFFAEQNLESLLNLLNRLMSVDVSYKNHLAKKTHDQLHSFLTKIKTKGLVL